MTASPVEHRFYGELAGWWPLISPPEEYGEEAEFAAGLLDPGPVAWRAPATHSRRCSNWVRAAATWPATSPTGSA